MNIFNRFRSAWLMLPCAWLMATPCPAQTASAPAGPAEHQGTSYSLDHGPYDLNAPTSAEEELNEILEPHTAMFNVPLIERPFSALLSGQSWLNESTGLRVGMAYGQLYQQASGGPGERWGMAGRVDFLAAWTLIGRGTENTGRLVFSFDHRFAIGSEIPPTQLAGQVGSLVPTTGGFSDRGFVIRDLFWDQWLFDGKVRVLIGRASPDDYVGAHRLQTSNFGFVNGNLSTNPTMVFAGTGPLALVSVEPTDLFYVTAGAANAYGNATVSGFNRFVEEGQFYGFGELGLLPEIEHVGRGRIALTGWNMPGRPLNGLRSDWGINITIEQYFADRWWAYARYGYADQGLSGVTNAWSAAVAVDGLLGSPDNLTALGFGYAQPASHAGRDETSFELFQRFQITQHVQFTTDAQLIIDPSFAPRSNAVGVFSFRLRIDL
jgi:porin